MLQSQLTIIFSLTLNLRNFSKTFFPVPAPARRQIASLGPYDISRKTYRSINILTFFPVSSFMLFPFFMPRSTTNGIRQQKEHTTSAGTSEKAEKSFVEIIMPVKV